MAFDDSDAFLRHCSTDLLSEKTITSVKREGCMLKVPSIDSMAAFIA